MSSIGRGERYTGRVRQSTPWKAAWASRARSVDPACSAGPAPAKADASAPSRAVVAVGLAVAPAHRAIFAGADLRSRRAATGTVSLTTPRTDREIAEETRRARLHTAAAARRACAGSFGIVEPDGKKRESDHRPLHEAPHGRHRAYRL
jgi:hypothetical protein